jgi:uncharacterized protein (DUF2141 family)
MKATTACLAATLLLAPRLPAQVPARDAAAAVMTGSASIDGMVVTDDLEAKPVRLASVALSSSTMRRAPVTTTDDTGRLSVRQLPAGRYSVSVSKAGFVPTSYGAKRPGGSGVPVVIAEGEQAHIIVRIARGGVISGTIRGPGGDPAGGVQMQLFGYDFSMAGDRTLSQQTFSNSANGSLITDDRGAYRIYGLRPGDYYVAAQPRGPGGGQVSSAAAFDWAERLLASPGTPPAVAAPPAQAVALVPVLYPGTTDPASAVPITVGVGEARDGVDFSLDFVPTATVSGRIVDSDGFAPKIAQVSLLRPMMAPGLGGGSGFIRPDADGHFSTSGIAPGDYVLAARGSARVPDGTPAGGSTTEAQLPLWGLLNLHVDGRDVAVDVRLTPGANISGRFVFDGATAKPPADLTKFTVLLSPVQAPGLMSMAPSPGPANADGTFTLHGVGAGRYQLSVNLAAAPGVGAWTLKSAVVRGVDSLDRPFDIDRDDIENAVITLTDHPTDLSGALLDAAGQPAPDYVMLVASTDRAFWTPRSRRIKAARPGSNGNFSLIGLPAGEYYLLALTDLEQNRMYSPAYLEPLVAAAMKITLADGEKKVQSFKIAGGRAP